MDGRNNKFQKRAGGDNFNNSFYDPEMDEDKIVEIKIRDSEQDFRSPDNFDGDYPISSPNQNRRKSIRKTPIMRNLKTTDKINKPGESSYDQFSKLGSEHRSMGNPYTKNLVRQPLIELQDFAKKKSIDLNSVTRSKRGVVEGEDLDISRMDRKSTIGSGGKLKRNFSKGEKSKGGKSKMSKIEEGDKLNNEEGGEKDAKSGKTAKTAKTAKSKKKDNPYSPPKKNSDLLAKAFKKEEQEKLKLLMDNNRKKIENVRSIFYFSVEAKNEVTNYIVSSGNYDSRNREVPWYIILPNGKVKRTWDVLMTFFLLFSLVIIPIDVGWNLECFTANQGEFFRSFYTYCSILFMFDILLNFFTAVLNEKNQYIYNPSYISNHYLTNNFIFDAMAATPFDKFKEFDITDCFKDYIPPSKVFLLFNLVRFLKLGKYIAIIEDILNKYITIVRLVKICLTLLYLAHFFGNFFAGNSSLASDIIFESCNGQDTIESKNACMTSFMQENIVSIYFYSVYIGMYFLTGNELEVSAYWERLYSVLVVVFGLGLNASVFGNVAVLLGKMSVGLDPFVQEKIDIMKEYMNFMKFETETIDIIQEYHKNIWMKQRNMMYPEDFFDNLSSALHKLILLDQWKMHLFEISIF